MFATAILSFGGLVFGPSYLKSCSLYSPRWRARATRSQPARGAGTVGYRDAWSSVTSLNRESLHRHPFLESRITIHAPSARGLSLPAIDSRIEVSAWTFFIR